VEEAVGEGVEELALGVVLLAEPDEAFEMFAVGVL
jgi:hypothetical protein